MQAALIFDLDGVLINSEQMWDQEKHKMFLRLFGEDVTEKLGSTMGVNIAKLRIILTPTKLKGAYGSLMFLSNSIPRRGRRANDEPDLIMLNHDHREKVKAALIPQAGNNYIP